MQVENMPTASDMLPGTCMHTMHDAFHKLYRLSHIELSMESQPMHGLKYSTLPQL